MSAIVNTDPIAALAEAARWCRRANEPDVRGVGEALASWLEHGGDLAEALGVKPLPGQRTAQTHFRIQTRDELLRTAAGRLCPDTAPAEGARVLHQIWNRYAATAWTRERGLPECPSRHVGSGYEILWLVMRDGSDVLSERHLRRILGHELGGIHGHEND